MFACKLSFEKGYEGYVPGAAWMAVALHIVHFSAYHFFAPWQMLTRVLALVPLVCVAYWKRNVYIGMVAHVGLNLLGVLEALPKVLGAV